MFHATMNFGLSEEIDALREATHRFAQDRSAPLAAQIDKDDAFPRNLWNEMGEMGLLGVTAGEEFGGAEMGYLAHCIVVEEIARVASLSRLQSQPLPRATGVGRKTLTPLQTRSRDARRTCWSSMNPTSSLAVGLYGWSPSRWSTAAGTWPRWRLSPTSASARSTGTS